MAGERKRNGRCSSGKRVTAHLLLSFLALSSLPTPTQSQGPIVIPPQIPIPPHSSSHDFTLRHIFHRGTYQDPYLHKRLDIRPESALCIFSTDDPPQREPYPHFEARSHGVQIQRLKDRRLSVIDSHLSTARASGQAIILDASQWTTDDLEGPNVTDKDTIVNLATMAANAYAPIVGEGEWEDVKMGYNYSQGFGWEGDGLRGYIFADKDNSTIILSLKGTSPAVFDGDGTTTRDKLNDNLFFSCCCAQGGQYFWRQVCDCYSSTYSCNQTCLVKALRNENRYYRSAIELYTNVTAIYPDSNVWLTGHSLGGSVSSLLGLTFGLPVVTFEAPGEALAAARLGLPAPPGSDPARPQERKYTGSVHVGHTADPVFMGTCNGATATCTLGGYAMESQCHTGVQCVYDTVGDFGWRVGIGNHKIHIVIDDVLKKYDEVPKCVPDDECTDCFLWKYFESNGSDTTTTSMSSTSTSTRTRTSTCKTPGWWGCLDETTATTKSTSTSTSTTTTSTCKTPGWFGCNDPTTTSTVKTATATAAPSSTAVSATKTSSLSTATCSHPGFFGGCRDSTMATSSRSSSHHHHKSHSLTTSSCKTPGFFFGCRDKDTHSQTFSSSMRPPVTAPSSMTPSVTSKPTSTKTEEGKCTKRFFFGLICLDSKTSRNVAVVAPTSRGGSEGEWNSEL